MKKILLLATIFSSQVFAHDIYYMRCEFSSGSSQSVWVQAGHAGQFINDCQASGGRASFPEWEPLSGLD